MQWIDIFSATVYNNSNNRQRRVSVQALKLAAYRKALLCGAFERGCAVKPQTGVGVSRKKMLKAALRMQGGFSVCINAT